MVLDALMQLHRFHQHKLVWRLASAGGRIAAEMCCGGWIALYFGIND